MSKKIVICLGSSCYSRGNQKSLEVIKDYLSKNSLDNEVDFSGQLCTGKCQMGPVLVIGGKTYTHVKPEGVLTILKNEIPVNSGALV